MNFIPLRDRIVVKRDIVTEKTLDSGLILRAEGQERPQTGDVLSIGSEVKDVEIGNRIIFGKHDGVEQEIEGERVLILRESTIWGILS